MTTILEFISKHILSKNSKAKVMVSCSGGHGRTGTILAIWAGLVIPEALQEGPVNYIRRNYCEEAVETLGQEMFVNSYLKHFNSALYK